MHNQGPQSALRARQSDVSQSHGGEAAQSAVEFAQLFESLPHPYLILRADADFTIVAVNDRYLKATGIERAQILGRGLFEVFPDNRPASPCNDVDTLRASLQRVLHDRTPDVMGVRKYDDPSPRNAKNVRVKYWKAINTPVFDSSGAVVFVIHHIEDATELSVANVSDEFQTPLTLMLGPLEDLLRTPPAELAMPVRASIERVYRNAQRLSRLVHTLMEFTSIEAGRVIPAPLATHVAQFTRGIASSFQALCERAGLTLSIDCPPADDWVSIDRDMWEKIVLHLLSNAFKFTFEGGIDVQMRSDGDCIELSVRDTGIGIPARELPRIFERFYRSSAGMARTYEGSGIGLALVKELVELLAGTISVQSQEGRGTCFTVRIPRRTVETAESTSTKEAPEQTCGANTLAGAFVQDAQRWLSDAKVLATAPLADVSATRRRILVVDDDADMRSYIRQLLEDADYEIETAPDGVSALERCEARSPDLILADVIMPRMSGIALMNALRADKRTARLPIILLSARAAEDFRIEGVRSDADDYVMKPFHARELVTRVDAVMRRAAERKRAEAELRQAAAVFTGTAEAVIITDGQRRILAVNNAFTRITGFESAEVVGRTPRFQRSGHHDAKFYEQLWATLSSNGHWEGEIWNRRKSGEMYPAWENISVIRDESGQVLNYVAVLSDISSIKESEARLAHMAHHDALTDLPNRLLFAARLEQSLDNARRHGSRVGLLLLDLDRFKLINDTLGHPVGDRLLQSVADSLRHSVRAEDTVARLGGDEFVVIVTELSAPQDAALVAEKILARINAPIALAGREFVTSASIGISIYPDDAESSEDLLKAADTAMYRAKQNGRHALEFYTAELTALAEEHVLLEMQLRRALSNGELALHYQPQMDLRSGEIVGLEALLRWRHPTRGMVPTNELIKVAEESGLIVQIGEWVVSEALRQAARWNAQGVPAMHLAVNLSGRQMAQNQIVLTIENALRQEQLGDWRVLLEVEVTETVIADHCCIDVLHRLRALGISVAIDDFGTGYSSLSRLKSLPIDVLKIDRSFINGVPHDANSVAITSAVISMGRALGLRVIAEGVETQEQLQFLRDQSCDTAQGFLICEPVDAETFAGWLRRDRQHLTTSPPVLVERALPTSIAADDSKPNKAADAIT